MIKDYLQELYKLRTEPPFLTYDKLVQYLSGKYNIKINKDTLRYHMNRTFPNMSKKIENTNDERYFCKDGKISSKERKIVLELLEKGNTQEYIANLFNINQSYVSRILTKSKLEIEDVKKARISNKLGDIDFDDINKWWYECQSINAVKNKCIKIGCDVTIKETRYILRKILRVKRYCEICNAEIKLEGSKFCSQECRRQAELDKIKTNQINRRIKGKGKTTQLVSRSKKIREANGICYLCGERLDTTIKDVYHPLYIVLDHVEALVYSNDSSEDNLKPVCRCCNSLKGDRPKEYYNMEQYKNNRKIKIESYVPKKISYKPIDKEQFILDCNNGMTTKELCKKYNRSNFIIWKHKKNLGLKINKKINKKLDKEYITKEIARLTNEGKTIREIVGILNISAPSVSNYRKRAILKGVLCKKR